MDWFYIVTLIAQESSAEKLNETDIASTVIEDDVDNNFNLKSVTSTSNESLFLNICDSLIKKPTINIFGSFSDTTGYCKWREMDNVGSLEA